MKRAASKGANVLINYTKSEAEAHETTGACRRLGADASPCRGDVSVDEDCLRMVSQAIGRWGRIDGLVDAGMHLLTFQPTQPTTAFTAGSR